MVKRHSSAYCSLGLWVEISWWRRRGWLRSRCPVARRRPGGGEVFGVALDGGEAEDIHGFLLEGLGLVKDGGRGGKKNGCRVTSYDKKIENN